MWSLDLSCCDEETTAFFQQGPNQGLYEAITVAKFSSQDHIGRPNIIIKNSIDKTVIVTNNLVTIFKNSNEVCLSVEFESLVECVAITEDSELLFVGEKSGHISIQHIDSQKRLIRQELTKPVEDKGSFFDIICYTNEGFFEVAVLTIRQKIHCFKKIDLNSLKTAFSTENLLEVKKKFCTEQFQSLELYEIYENSLAKGLFFSECESSLNCYGSGQYIIGCNIAEDKIEDYVHQFEPYTSVKKARFSNDGRYIFAIDNQGNFLTLCRDTLSVIQNWNSGKIIDFTMLESSPGNRSRVVSQRKLVFLLERDDDLFEIVYKDFPSLKNCYKVKVSNFCRLSDPLNNEDGLLNFVEGISSKFNENIDVIKIRQICEAQPQMRLQKLIQKRRFREAETFARQFNLDLQSVFKAEVTYLASEDISGEILETIKRRLIKIKDAQFVSEFALKIRLPNQELTREMFQICLQVLGDFPEVVANFQKPISQNEEKLNTFLVLNPDPEKWNSWFDFCKKSVSSLFVSFLKSNEISQAFFLWSRHYNEILSEENQDFVEVILDSIPVVVQSNDLMSFLKESFLQPVFLKFPDSVDYICEWILKRAKLYEVAEESDWPSNSLKLLSVFAETCSLVSDKYHRVALRKDQFRQLNALLKSLEELSTLRSNYGCFLSTQQYCMSDKTQVAFVILDLLVKGNKLENGMKGFLPNFFKDHELMEERVLLAFIADCVRSQSVPWWYHTEAPWEYAALKVVHFIRKSESRTQAVKLILGHAPVPWSQSIREFAQKCAREPALSKHAEIEVQRANLKRILIKYRLTSFNYNCASDKAYSLMFFILTQSQDDVLVDSLQVVEWYPELRRSDCYLRYAVILLDRREISRLIDLYSDLSAEDSIDCGPRIYNFCESILQHSDIQIAMGHYDYLVNASFVATRVTSRLLKLKPNDPDWEISFQLAKQVYSLQTEFNCFEAENMAITQEDKWKLYSSIANEGRPQLPQGVRLSEGERKVKEARSAEKSLVESLVRLGDVLSLPKGLVYGDLIERLILRSHVDQAKLLITDVVKSNCPDKVIFQVLKRLLSSKELFATDNVAGIVADLHAVSCQLLVDCQDYLMMECIHLCQWTSALVSLYALDTRLACRRGQVPQPLDKYNVWKFSKIYRDQGLAISVKDILPNFLECLTVSNFTSKRVDLSTLLRLFALSRNILLKLRSKAQDQMALSLFVFLQTNFVARTLENEPRKDFDPKELSALKDVNSEFKSALKEVCASLIHKIVSQGHCDYSAGLGVLTVLTRDDALQLIKRVMQRYAKDHSRLKSFSVICFKFGMEMKNQSLSTKAGTIYRNACWLEDLNKLKINCKDVPNEENSSLILADLMKCPALELRQLALFCSDFNQNKDQIFFHYLKYLIQSDLVQLWGVQRIPNETETTKLQELLTKCQTIVNCVADKNAILDVLIEIFPLVNSYCYEALNFICQSVIQCSLADHPKIVRQNWEKNSTILAFLERYVRVSPPTEIESETWLRNHPDDDQLPDLASLRLPFHLLSQSSDKILKIIDPELFPENVGEWLLVATIFSLRTDQVKIRALKNDTIKWLSRQPKGEELLGETADVEFIQRVGTLVMDIDDFDMAFKLVSWIINKIPSCETKVQLTRSLATLSERSGQKTGNPKLIECAKQSRNLYKNVSLELLLKKYGFSQSHYSQLMHDPEKLIVAILEDKLKTELLAVSDKKAAFALVKQIAKLVNCDLNEIYASLLTTWMPWTNLDGGMIDDTFTLNVNQLAMDFTSNDREIWTDNLWRSVNLLRDIECQDQMIEYLKRFESENCSCVQRVQSLMCFLLIFNEEETIQIVGKTRQKLREYLSDLIFVSQLEELQLPYPLEVFQEWDKRDLIKNVLSNTFSFPKALSLASSLCIREEIWDEDIWDSIFRNMISLRMNEELRRLLERINHQTSFWLSPSYSKAWTRVINNKIEQCQSQEDAQYIFTLVSKSNCLKSLNLIEMAKELAKYGVIPALATALLLPDNKQMAKEFVKRKGLEKTVIEFQSFLEHLPNHKKVQYSMVEALLKEMRPPN